jgi:hypothetical protein
MQLPPMFSVALQNPFSNTVDFRNARSVCVVLGHLDEYHSGLCGGLDTGRKYEMYLLFGIQIDSWNLELLGMRVTFFTRYKAHNAMHASDLCYRQAPFYG